MTTSTMPAAKSARRRFTMPPLRRPHWLPPWTGRVLAGLAIAVAGFILGLRLSATTDERDVAVQQRDATAVQAVQATDPVLQLCADPTPVGDALRNDPRDPCELAEKVQATPVPGIPGATGPAGPSGERGPGPTEAQVRAAVSAYLTANPPAPGRAPTAAEISGAVAAYLAANPPPAGPPGVAGENGQPGQPGQEGAKGEPGRAPTDEEVAAAVAAYLAANPPPAGPAGPPGPVCPPGETPQTVTYGLGGPTGTACVAS